MMDLFSSTFGSFIVVCDILPNLDENDTLFLYREQNEQLSSKVGLMWSSIFGRLLFSIISI